METTTPIPPGGDAPARGPDGMGRGDTIVEQSPSRGGLSRGARLGALTLLALASLYLLVLFLRPFLPAIITSAVIAVLADPVYRRFDMHRRRSLVALLATAILFLLVLLPLGAVSLVIAAQLPAWAEWAAEAGRGLLDPGGRIYLLLAGVASRLGVDPAAISVGAPEQVQQLAALVAGGTFRILSGLGGWMLQAGVAVFTLYYMLRDADRIIAWFKWVLPLDADDADDLLSRSREVVFAAVYGNVIIALVQGVLGGIIFWMLDVPAPALWGLAMGLLGLLPVIGPPVIWLPAGLLLIVTGSLGRGLVLLALGTILISGIDNVIRPLIVSGRTQLHPLVVFFSVLGGVPIFGAVGIFVGPVVFAGALTLIEIARAAVMPDDAGAGRLLVGPPPSPPPPQRSVRVTGIA